MSILSLPIAILLVLICTISSYQQPNVWSTFGDLAHRTAGSINLGQGYPDWDPPAFILDALRSSSYHQYTRPAGHVKLVELLAQRYGRHLNKHVHAMDEVAVTVGASQALYLALLTLLKPGQEVLLFDPFFELYAKQIALIGAKARYVSLGLPVGADGTWTVDLAALESGITENTKVLILNSPHNPTGKVFTRSELEGIADIVRRHPQVTVLYDEVYKYTVYNPLEAGDPTARGHTHFAALPDMWDRTVTISSCGKTFSVTGWQVGWMVAPSKFIKPVQDILPCVQFCAASPIQEALCQALAEAEKPYIGHVNYYEYLRAQFVHKRQLLEVGLRAADIQPLPSHGGYFLLGLLPQVSSEQLAAAVPGESYDWSYVRMLAEQRKVIGIPASPFFSAFYASPEQRAQGLAKWPAMARFAFCKKDSTLQEAQRLLMQTSKLIV